MAGTQIQGFDAFSQMQQLSGARTQGGTQGRREDGAGEFGELIEKASELLDTVRSAGPLTGERGFAVKPQVSADTELQRMGGTQNRSPVKDAVNRPEAGKDRQTDTAGQTNKTNQNDQNDKSARVTDDKAEKELHEEADDAGRKLVSEVAEKLDVDEAEVEAAMEVLGLTAMQLLDPANLTALITEVSGESDPMALVTDAELYEALQELTSMAEELSEEIGVTPEQVNAFAEELEAAAVNGEELPQQAVVHETQTDADGNAVAVEVTVTDGGQVVRESAQSSHSEQDHSGGERQGRGEHRGEIDHQTAAENMVNELAGRMAENNVRFDEAVPAEQVAGANQQEMVEIVRQITEQIRVNISSDVTSMELQLHPASLGNVQLTVLQDQTGRMVAQFAVENETVRQAIEGQVSMLQQQLDERGVRIEAVEVTLASHGFESNLNGQNAGQEADEQRERQLRAAGPRGPRRINLSDVDFEEEEMAEEERIAAEMMAANGNTVDYTA